MRRMVEGQDRGFHRSPHHITSSPESSSSSRSSDRFEVYSEDDHRRDRNCKSSRSEVISSACRYTQAEVTPGNCGVLAAACSHQLHVDFDDEHQVWHLVVPPSTTPSSIEGTSIVGSEKRRGIQLEGPRSVERSSSANEEHSSGSRAAGGTTGSSRNRGLVKTNSDSTCRAADDAGSSEIHGGFQRPAGDGGQVSESTPAKKRGLPSKEETITTADEQETNGPTEVLPNRDNTEGEPLVKVSKVLESEAGTPSDNMNQLETVEHNNNAGATGDGDRETEEGTQQSPPPQEEARKCFTAEPEDGGEGVSKDAHLRASGLQAEDDEPMALDAEKSERDAALDGHAAVTRDERHLTASGVGQEEKEEGREAADGGKGEDGRGNKRGEQPEGSKGGGVATSQGLDNNNSRKVASNNNVRFDRPAIVEKETRSMQARETEKSANVESDSVGKPHDRLLYGGNGNEECSDHQRDAAMQVTWRGQTVPLAKSIVITIKGSRLGEPLPERQVQGDRESHPRRKQHIISDGQSRQREGHNRNLAAEASVNNVFSSDEGSDEQMPAQGEGKTNTESCTAERYDRNADAGGKRASSSRSRVPRSARNGDEEAKRVGESRRSIEEASPAIQNNSEAKGEAAGRASFRADDYNLQRPCRRRQRAGEEALSVARSDSPPSPTSDRGHCGRGSSGGRGRTLPRLTRPVFFLADPYLGPPIAACPRAWPCGRNVMVDSTADCCRSRRRHRRGRRRVSNSHGSGTSHKARRRIKSGERAADEGRARNRSSENIDSSPWKRRSESDTSSDCSGSSNSTSSSSSSGVFNRVEHKQGERPAEAKRGPTTTNRGEKASEERRPQWSSRRGSIQRASTIGEEKGCEAW